MILSTEVGHLLHVAGDLFRAGEIRIEKERLATATGSLGTYAGQMRGPFLVVAQEIGPMVRYHTDVEPQAWSPNHRDFAIWFDEIQTDAERAARVVAGIDYLTKACDKPSNARTVLFLLFCYAETSGCYAEAILQTAEEEGFELPRPVRDQLVVVKEAEAELAARWRKSSPAAEEATA